MYACNGILFNHESPRRGETFVTRKITRGLCNIALGLDDSLYMGNMDSLRDWGHTRDYVEMQWLMLQQDEPEDFVIATGQQISVRQFVTLAAESLGIELEWRGKGLHEKAVVTAIADDALLGADEVLIKIGQVIVQVDPKYFRPAEVETLLGDPSMAKQKLGWQPTSTLAEMIEEMVSNDLDLARQQSLLASKGYTVNQPHE